MAENKGDATEYISLKVLGQDETVVRFKIRKNTPLKKLMNAYCEKTGLNISKARFRYDGLRIGENDTLSSMDIEEGDTIEVFLEQTGGCFYFNCY